MTLPPGTMLGRYEVCARLGAGGMGEVYLARDTQLGRDVAVKILPGDLALDGGRLDRFVREARAASALNHPNILTVHEIGFDRATHFIATEFVDGITLREWASRGDVEIDDIVDAGIQVASALATAHEAGIVHRDIKPENLMRRRDGYVKVLDFGLAKLTRDSGTANITADHPTLALSEPGVVLGTVRYMSPEQASGLPVDPRTDIWSLGVVLYELAAGHVPFSGPTPLKTLIAIIEREPAPLDPEETGVPPTLASIISKALAKTPNERYQSARELVADLTEVRREIDFERRRGASGGHAASGPLFERRPRNVRPTPVSPADAATAIRDLPARSSPLIGREGELADLVALLRREGVRLVTLTGAGGTGKTRLALEVARVLTNHFFDGVFAIELDALADAALLPSHVAGALGLRDPGGRPADALAEFLRERQVLLLLDNFEHLVNAAPFVSGLLAAAPGLRVLATSREPLRLRLEHEYPLDPLAVPEFSSLPPLDELAAAPAVALFVERAREARSSFALTHENARVVAEICRRLDGLPLAIELAAARVKLFPPQQLLSRLENRLQLLTGGARDLPDRQKTMRGAVAWSYDLLEVPERAMLRRLSVFAGGFTLEAAEAIVPSTSREGRQGSPCGPSWSFVDCLSALVDKSLVVAHEVAGEPRYRMLEVVREFGIEQLEAEVEDGEARRAHADFFATFVHEAEPHLPGAEQGVWLERIAREHENLRAALGFLIEREPERGAWLAAALGRFWLSRNHYAEGRAWLRRALAAPGIEAGMRARLLRVLGGIERRTGDLAAAGAHLREGVEVGRASGDPRVLAQALNSLGAFYFHSTGETETARGLFAEALAIARETGDRPLISGLLGNLGVIASGEGDRRAARSYYEQSLEAEGVSRTYTRATILSNLGALTLEESDHDASSAYYLEGLSIALEIGDRHASACALDGIAANFAARGDASRAARIAGAVAALHESIGVTLEPTDLALRDRYVAAAREALGPEAFDREWSLGRQLTLDQAAAEALRHTWGFPEGPVPR